MAEKKNLTIKVKYPTAAKTSKALSPSAAVITVWNVQRIGLAAAALLGFLLLIVYAFSDDDTPPPAVVADSPSAQAAPAQAVPAAPKTPAAQPPVVTPVPVAANPSVAVALPHEQARIRRAVLAARITDKEPADEIVRGVTVPPGQLKTAYYFNELRGMTGKILYHEWLRDGVSVMKEPLQVGADRWRVSSHKTFDDKAAGQWTVRLLDDTGKLLDEKTFAVSVGQ
ncbi:DUF2914 domain-containing protein [Methylovulum psychrotolerans]|uniref:DUF2914 domain-containing protein n=1 Tax=Methylovulum psychrotolerans TaxID=1704499 RepID=A0A2S5CNM4_9GAMM|nr:DUF2914 domain-containing protein [Methylovulum psychrotolerans]POZ52376.1 hypothetical protein AADEFJLK_01858 [Methylovulum psychrotolerans]